MNNGPKIMLLNEIKAALEEIDVFDSIKKGFIAYSQGEAVIPPVGELIFEHPPGDVHIKYGYIQSQPYYVVKIASGFYDNPQLGLPSSNGLNLLFDKETGILKSILLDEGHLTDVRTAVAGALASKALARSDANTLGIIGTGTQGRMQLHYHAMKFDLKKIYYWNRDYRKSKELVNELKDKYNVEAVDSIEMLCHHSDIIVTTTPSKTPLIKDEWISEGTHITAVGSDTSEKIELEPQLLDLVDIVVVDSLEQSRSRGEVYRARKTGVINNKSILELGIILSTPQLGRIDDRQISIADLTGVAVQDLMISQAVFENR